VSKIMPLPAAKDPVLLEAALDEAFAKVCRYQYRPERVLPSFGPVTVEEYIKTRGRGPDPRFLKKLIEARDANMSLTEAAHYAGCSVAYAAKIKRDFNLAFRGGRKK
jgi:hypothetical protein